MARAASNRLLAALLCAAALAGPLRADYDSEEQARRDRRVQENIWQAVFGQRVVQEARKQLGKPYVWGAKTGDPGFDCSGFTAYVFNSMGVKLAASALLQYQQGVEVEQAGLQAGDLVFFLGDGSPLHVGIYAGDGRFLHAPGTGKVIAFARLDAPYFAQRYVGARRVTPSLDEERIRRAPTPGTEPVPSPTPAQENVP